MVYGEKEMAEWLEQFTDDTVCAERVERAVVEKGVNVTENFSEFLELLQIPVVYGSMFSRLLEVKAIFRPEIETFRERRRKGKAIS